MKKNFLKVAALLVAAMLMVVSCSQEVKAPENNGLINAKLGVAYGRDLIVTGDTKQDDFKLYYKMEPGWTLTGATETVYGGTKQNDGYVFKELTINNSTGIADLGYVTPGLWKITVVAKGHNGNESENSKDIFTSGETGFYFNDTTKHATLFLTPVASDRNTLNFNFKMQALSDATNNGDYVVEYKYRKDGESYGTAREIPCTVDPSTKVATYTLADSVSIESGYYTVNVSIYRKAVGATPRTLVGGVTKGFLASGGATVSIGGNIQPSDYEKVSINAYYVKVNTSIATIPTVTYYKGAAKEDGSSDPNYAKITATVTDTTSKIGSGYDTATYLWSVVSDGREITSGQTNSPSFTFTVKNGGYKTITCTTIYSIDNSSTSDTDDKVYFANTVSKQVDVDPKLINSATVTEPTSNS